MHGLVRAAPIPTHDDAFVTRLSRYTDLSPSDIRALRALIESEPTIEKRRDLVVEGYEYRKLSFITEGFGVRYKLLRNGKRQIINILIPGDVIGLPGSFLERAGYSVIAVTDLKLQVCSLDSFVALCYQRPKFGLALSWLAVEESVTNAEHLIDIGRRTPIERLARFLLELHGRLKAVGRATEQGFDLPVSQELLSDTLGLSVPHLNRMFARLRADGMITLHERHVEFIDRKALELLSHYHPPNLTRIPRAGAAL
jgi:CRP-like cAMP-binding protein